MKSVDDWIAYANSIGLHVCCRQLDNGKWWVSCKVAPVTPELARDPVYTDHGEGTTPSEAFWRCFASEKFRMAWEPKAEAAVKAMKPKPIIDLDSII